MNDPALLVALPAPLRELLGRGELADVSGVLAEWGSLVDPAAALADAAATDATRIREWRICGRTSVSSGIVRQLREAARRDDVSAALVALTPGREVMDPRTMPFLVGLAIAASIRVGAGVLSHTLREQLKARRQEDAERRSASGAGEAPTSAAPIGAQT